MSPKRQSITISTMAIVLIALSVCSYGVLYNVGDSSWSIPEYSDFYSDWSSSQFFKTGDSLFFEFESEQYNVIQVSPLEYEKCTAENPFKVFKASPVTILLEEKGVYNFICNVSNYCSLGQKVSVAVHKAVDSSYSPPLPAETPKRSVTPALSPQPSSSDRDVFRPVAGRNPAPPRIVDGNSLASGRTSCVAFPGFCIIVVVMLFI